MITRPTQTVVATPSTASTQQTMTATGSTALAPRCRSNTGAVRATIADPSSRARAIVIARPRRSALRRAQHGGLPLGHGAREVQQHGLDVARGVQEVTQGASGDLLPRGAGPVAVGTA